MTLRELKEAINNFPEKYDDYPVFDGKFKQTEDGNLYRIDDEITMVVVDRKNYEILILTEEILEEDEK